MKSLNVVKSKHEKHGDEDVHCDVGFGLGGCSNGDSVGVHDGGGVDDGEYRCKGCFQTDKLTDIGYFRVTFATVNLTVVMWFIFLWRWNSC